jgi:hypothetical protein
LGESLANTRDATMAENPEAAGKERLPFSIALHVLMKQELNDSLSGGESFRLHAGIVNGCSP